ncbi:MAG TPA: shikimate dehydrogenase [Casimicrobiaceae bacterium]|nr:shikimate dehydrogenase [Casimicrobiaceae bacterium]
MTGGKASPAGRRAADRTSDAGADSRSADARPVDRYAVIGNPVAHSKSPLIHDAFAQATGQRMRYERLLAPLDGFDATVRTFSEANGRGLNVTIPFKLQAFALTRERSARAQSARACNTLAWRGDHWFGDNTDGAGLTGDLTRNLGETIAGRNLLVLGAGGAARGIAGALLAERPLRLVIANRTHAKAIELAAQFERDGPISAEPLASLSGQQFDIVVNATSLGLGTPVPAGLWPHRLFAAQALAYDLIYADQTTPFLHWARDEGAARTADGLGMLIEQAAESFCLWRGVRPDTAPVFRLLRPLGRG